MKAHTPKTDDWDRWFKLCANIGVEVQYSKDAAWSFIDTEEQKILIFLERTLLEEAPYTIEDIEALIYCDGTLQVSGAGMYAEDSDRKFRSTLTKALRDMSVDYGSKSDGQGFLKIFTASEWREKFKKEKFSKRIRKLNGNTTLYTLTAKGSLAYEASLTIPCLSLSVLPIRNDWAVYSAKEFAINWGILSRVNGDILSWGEDFIEKYCDPKHDNTYFLNEAKKRKKILGKEYDFFIRMVNPLTLLAREYCLLTEIRKYLERQLKQEVREARNEAPDPYAAQAISNTKISIETLLELVIFYQETVIRSRIESFDCSAESIIRNKPSRDPIIEYIRTVLPTFS